MFSRIFLSIAFAFLAVHAVDINEVKRNAIKRVEAQVEKIKQLADRTGLEVEERERNIGIINSHEREYGNGVYETTLFQVAKNAKSAYMLSTLMNYPNEVFRCIEDKERRAKDETIRFNTEKFLKPAQEYVRRAEEVQRDQIKGWKDEYYKAINQYATMYQNAVKEIQRANSESQINNVVRQFDQNTEEMSKIIVKIFPSLNNTHVQILRILNNIVNDVQRFSVYTIQKTAELINNCFPKAFNFDLSTVDDFAL